MVARVSLRYSHHYFSYSLVPFGFGVCCGRPRYIFFAPRSILEPVWRSSARRLRSNSSPQSNARPTCETFSARSTAESDKTATESPRSNHHVLIHVTFAFLSRIWSGFACPAAISDGGLRRSEVASPQANDEVFIQACTILLFQIIIQQATLYFEHTDITITHLLNPTIKYNGHQANLCPASRGAGRLWRQLWCCNL